LPRRAVLRLSDRRGLRADRADRRQAALFGIFRRVLDIHLGDRVRGVGETGSKYLLSEAELSCGYPLGVSNSFSAARAEISVREGMLVVYWGENAEKPLPEREAIL
jgi:thiamine pyrophosphokinase